MRTLKICLTGFLMGAYLSGNAVLHFLTNEDMLKDIRRPR